MDATTDKDKPKDITILEEKEMMRVFDLLCDFKEKTEIKTERRDLKEYIERSLAETSNIADGSRLDISIKNASRRISELDKTISAIETKPNKKISSKDVHAMYKFLDYKVTPIEIDEIIWEVDENLDKCIDYKEFRLMFSRNVMDRTGLEPNRMFNLAQFLIYDNNENGKVSVDETMNLLYARYGRSTMESKLKELFGEDMHETGREGGEITFTKYLNAVERVQMNIFLSTTKGAIAASKGFGKKKK